MGLQRRLERTHERRAMLKRELLKLRVATSRLTRKHAEQTAQQRKLARALKQVYSSRSWRWTAPFRRAPGENRGSRLKSFARSLRGWAHAARTLISPSRLRDVRGIARCGLFDEAFYLRTYPDVARAAIPPLVHYVVIGAREGRRPHPLFDGKYYLARQCGCPQKRREPTAALRAARRHVGPRSSPAVLGPLLSRGESGHTGDERRPPLALHDARKSERTYSPPALRPGLLPGSLPRCPGIGRQPACPFCRAWSPAPAAHPIRCSTRSST